MIRQNRNREKLANYYNMFTQMGTLDPNVHPWVAESWEKSKQHNIDIKRFNDLQGLNKDELKILQGHHRAAIEYMQEYTEGIKDFLQEYDLSLLLLD